MFCTLFTTKGWFPLQGNFLHTYQYIHNLQANSCSWWILCRQCRVQTCEFSQCVWNLLLVQNLFIHKRYMNGIIVYIRSVQRYRLTQHVYIMLALCVTQNQMYILNIFLYLEAYIYIMQICLAQDNIFTCDHVHSSHCLHCVNGRIQNYFPLCTMQHRKLCAYTNKW